MQKQFTSFVPDWASSYRPEWLRGDLSAGVTVGIMLIPQGMAYAMLAGLPPIHGLYAATLPLLAYAILGTSRQLAVGPVAMDSLLTAASLGAITVVGSEHYLVLAAVLALLVGGVQLVAGLLRLGFLVDLLSRPIISGFTSAAAIIIGASQLKHLLGIETARSSYVHDILWSVVQDIGNINLPTLLIGLGGMAIIIGVKQVSKLIPGPLVAVVAGILVVLGLGLTEQGVKIVGAIPGGFPPISIPAFEWSTVSQLGSAALTIALVGFMESIAVAKAVRNRHRDYELDANRELLALGAANVAAGVISGYPVTGGFSRTAVNDQAGAKTPLAGVISAVLIGLTLLFLTPLFYYLPQAILASLIMVAVGKLIDLGEVRKLWRLDRVDFWLLTVTFLGTLFLGIQLGIGLGVALSLGVHVYRSMRPHIAVLGRIPGTDIFRNTDRFGGGVGEVSGVLIIRFDGALYFGNLTYFQQQIRAVIAGRTDEVKVLILKGEGIHRIDSTALFDLGIFLEDLAADGIEVRFAGLIGPARDALQRSGLREQIGDHHFYLDVAAAIAAEPPAPQALQTNAPSFAP
jgi:SulP family sulfate permease